MPNINFEEIFKTLKAGVIQLAGQAVKSYAEQAKITGLNLIEKMKIDLEQWAGHLKRGELSESELRDLVKGQVTDTKLAALQQAGIAQIEFDKFKKGLVDLITTTLSTII